jgi:hypothetical protein
MARSDTCGSRRMPSDTGTRTPLVPNARADLALLPERNEADDIRDCGLRIDLWQPPGWCRGSCPPPLVFDLDLQDPLTLAGPRRRWRSIHPRQEAGLHRSLDTRTAPDWAGAGSEHAPPEAAQEVEQQTAIVDGPVLQGLSEWARLVSNQRPLACEASALPLSYAPWAGNDRRGIGAKRRELSPRSGCSRPGRSRR